MTTPSRPGPTTRPPRRRGRIARLLRYHFLRVARLPASPHEVALGVAAGAAISFTPLIGLHLVLACTIALITRGSMVAAAIGTLIGNPLTFPMFFGASYWIGDRLRGASDPAAAPLLSEDGMAPTSEGDEAEAAADLVLDAAEGLLGDGWLWGNLDALWPVFSTMLLGSLPLMCAVYAATYIAMRQALASLTGKRRLRTS